MKGIILGEKILNGSNAEQLEKLSSEDLGLASQVAERPSNDLQIIKRH